MLETLLAVVSVLAGFALLIKGADWLVDGGSALARLFKVSELVIGLTIVSLGTSMPELMVSLVAGFKGASDLVLGNVIGSNIMNTLLVLGITALVVRGGLVFARNTVLREIPFSLLTGVVLLILVNDVFFSSGIDQPDIAGFAGILSRGDGIILLCFFAIFTVYVISIAKGGDDSQTELEDEAGDHSISTPRATLLLVGGAVALAFGGQLTVDGGVKIAELFGVSQKLIGLLLLAGGTSLPELVTSVVAARKGRPGIAIGNVLGSNIANIFLVLGCAATITPMGFDATLNLDLGLVIFSSLLLFMFMFLSEDKRKITLSASKFRIQKIEAIAFLALYLGYCVFLFVRA
jgi:cation:H+ antiporter